MLYSENSKYLPIFLDIDNKNILIVGGGKVALRKASLLLSYNVNITIISPHLIHALELMATSNPDKIKVIIDTYKPEHLDIAQFTLVFAVTSDENINKNISEDAKQRGILANIATSLEGNHFIMPAIIKEGPFQIAVSTSGNSPLLAKMVKDDLKKSFVPYLTTYTELLGEIRTIMKEKAPDDISLRQKVYNKLLNTPELLSALLSEKLLLNNVINALIKELK